MTRLPEGVAERIAELVIEIVGEKKQGLVEVHEALRKEGIKVSMPTISKEAYRLGIKPAPGRRPGKLPPGTPRGGRPKGPGKKRSPYREDALEMRRQGMTTTAIGEKLGISRQAVDRLVSDDAAD